MPMFASGNFAPDTEKWYRDEELRKRQQEQYDFDKQERDMLRSNRELRASAGNAELGAKTAEGKLRSENATAGTGFGTEKANAHKQDLAAQTAKSKFVAADSAQKESEIPANAALKKLQDAFNKAKAEGDTDAVNIERTNNAVLSNNPGISGGQVTSIEPYSATHRRVTGPRGSGYYFVGSKDALTNRTLSLIPRIIGIGDDKKEIPNAPDGANVETEADAQNIIQALQLSDEDYEKSKNDYATDTLPVDLITKYRNMVKGITEVSAKTASGTGEKKAGSKSSKEDDGESKADTARAKAMHEMATEKLKNLQAQLDEMGGEVSATDPKMIELRHNIEVAKEDIRRAENGLRNKSFTVPLPNPIQQGPDTSAPAGSNSDMVWGMDKFQGPQGGTITPPTAPAVAKNATAQEPAAPEFAQSQLDGGVETQPATQEPPIASGNSRLLGVQTMRSGPIASDAPRAVGTEKVSFFSQAANSAKVKPEKGIGAKAVDAAFKVGKNVLDETNAATEAATNLMYDSPLSSKVDTRDLSVLDKKTYATTLFAINGAKPIGGRNPDYSAQDARRQVNEAVDGYMKNKGDRAKQAEYLQKITELDARARADYGVALLAPFEKNALGLSWQEKTKSWLQSIGK